MFKYIISLVCLVGIPIGICGQQLIVGPVAGGNLSRAFYDDSEYYDAFTSTIGYGYHGGVVINYKITQKFSWHTEALFTLKGRHIKSNDSEDISLREWQYFIEIPLLLRTSFKKGLFDYHVSIGPRISYWLGGKGVLKSPEFNEFPIDQVDYKIKFGPKREDPDAYYFQNPNRLQLGIDLGVGVNFPIRANQMMVDLRYTFGHTYAGNTDSRFIENTQLYEDETLYAIHMLNLSVAFLFEFDLFEIRTKGKSTGS